MARRPSIWTGPASSTGSPITFMMRPSVPSPTGTVIGPPVSVTSWPRTRPSEMSMAMQRTVSSPSCWATSRTRRWPLLSVSSALRIGGRFTLLSNFTSTTAPITWVMRPVALAILAMGLRPCPRILSLLRRSGRGVRSERLGARNDLDQFLGDHRLPGAIVPQGVFLHHVAGVARRVVHCAHLSAEERGLILEQGAIDAHRHRARQQLGEDFSFVRLILVSRRVLVLRAELGRDELLGGGDLRDHRLEARVEQRADVELAVLEQSDHLFGDRLGGVIGDRAHRAQVDQLQNLPLMRAPKLVIALLADAQDLDRLAFRRERARLLAR